MDIISRIDKLLKENGISGSKMSRDLGFSSGLYSQWKNGLQKPSNKKIHQIAKYFNVSVEYLLEGEKKEKPTQESADEIEVMTDKYLSDLFDSSTNTFMLNGKPASKEAMDYLREAIRFNIEYAKKINDKKNEEEKE